MNRLNENDEYLTLSNLHFWSRIKFESNHFLSENIRAAKRGVRIRRIILVNANALTSSQDFTYRNMAHQVSKHLYEKYQGNPEGFRNIEWHFFLSDDYEKHDLKPVPYAILRNRVLGEYMAVLPELARNEDQISHVEVHFSEDRNNPAITRWIDYFEDFTNKHNNLFTIPEFYEKFFLNKKK